MLKPMDIHNKEFKKAVRGYDMTELSWIMSRCSVSWIICAVKFPPTAII